MKTSMPVVPSVSASLINDLKRAARDTVAYFGISFGPNKINHLVTRFLASRFAESRAMFFEYLAAEVQLSEQQRCRARQLPSVRTVISYPDPTGEDAVNHVVRQRGY